jgi:hypothetical protein
MNQPSQGLYTIQYLLAGNHKTLKVSFVFRWIDLSKGDENVSRFLSTNKNKTANFLHTAPSKQSVLAVSGITIGARRSESMVAGLTIVGRGVVRSFLRRFGISERREGIWNLECLFSLHIYMYRYRYVFHPRADGTVSSARGRHPEPSARGRGTRSHPRAASRTWPRRKSSRHSPKENLQYS